MTVVDVAVALRKDRFGRIKWGSAFFDWLTATGTAVLLTALVTGVGGALGLANTPGGSEQAAGQATQAAQDPAAAQTTGIVASIVLLVVLIVVYYCGGYVAGRMARFNGIKQGLAVWVWRSSPRSSRWLQPWAGRSWAVWPGCGSTARSTAPDSTARSPLP